MNKRGVILGLLAWLALPARPAGPDWKRVLEPAALAGIRPPKSFEQLRAKFADPPAEFRSAPLWVWNDELEWPRLQQQLRQFKEQGMGGVFIHPRPGLMTEYLGERWFHWWRQSLAEAKKLGLLIHIYDENSYPSGFAGGHVVSRAPDTVGQVVTYEIRPSAKGVNWRDGSTVAVFAAQLDGEGRPAAVRRIEQSKDFPAGEPAVIMKLRLVEPRAWTGGFPYVDLTDPRTTELFLETTYEAYRRRFGEEFGHSVLWAFTDEPELSKLGGWSGEAVPLSLRALAEFRRRHDYDLADHLPSLFWDIGDYRRVRFDYWQFLHDRLIEAFFEPIFSWCDRNQLQWTGHWWEHLWPYPWATPADMSFYAFQHAPGIDMLGFQTPNLYEKGAEPHLLFTVKQVAGVANQLGRPRVLSETYGGGGWEYTMEMIKRLGDWQAVHGVNLVNQHLSHVTIRGARKRDWPQSFSDVAAWWPYYRPHGDHIARLSLALSSGEARNRVLVLVPTTSAFLWARRATPGGRIAELERMRSDFSALVQFLADHQADFDLGDEYVIEWFGKVEGSRFVVGRQTYDVVVWPKHMTNLRRQTAPLIEQFINGGGTVVALGEPAAYVDGRADASLGAKLRGPGWVAVDSHEALLEAVRKKAPARVKFRRSVPPGIGFAERFLDDGSRLLLFVNSGPEAIDVTATVPGAALSEWDTVSGDVRPFPVERKGAEVEFRLRLQPAGSLLLSAQTAPGPQPPPSREFRAQDRLGPRWRIEPDQPNVLVLDYCDVEVGGRKLRNVLAMTAGEEIFRAHGFPQNPWDRAIQFRSTVLDRNRFAADTGFTAVYRFGAQDEQAVRDLEIAVESPELYRVRVNGKAVDFQGAPSWLDPHLRRASIAGAARAGENTIEIIGRPFDVRMELEPVYVLGRFDLRPADRGFELAGPGEWEFGSWAKQGRPFYSGSVSYRCEVKVPAAAAGVRVELGNWNGSVAEVVLDGRRAAILGWPPWRADVELAPGTHELTVRVMGTPKNLFGAFHDPRTERPRPPWPGHWTLFAELPPPPGAAYQVLDYGLFEPPSIILLQ